MHTEAKHYLRESRAGRATLKVLGWAPLTAEQLAHVFRGRFARGTVRQAVLVLRRLGLVRPCGRYRRARQWIAKEN
jgi:hypothetical protein